MIKKQTGNVLMMLAGALLATFYNDNPILFVLGLSLGTFGAQSFKDLKRKNKEKNKDYPKPPM